MLLNLLSKTSCAYPYEENVQYSRICYSKYINPLNYNNLFGIDSYVDKDMYPWDFISPVQGNSP